MTWEAKVVHNDAIVLWDVQGALEWGWNVTKYSIPAENQQFKQSILNRKS